MDILIYNDRCSNQLHPQKQRAGGMSTHRQSKMLALKQGSSVRTRGSVHLQRAMGGQVGLPAVPALPSAGTTHAPASSELLSPAQTQHGHLDTLPPPKLKHNTSCLRLQQFIPTGDCMTDPFLCQTSHTLLLSSNNPSKEGKKKNRSTVQLYEIK